MTKKPDFSKDPLFRRASLGLDTQLFITKDSVGTYLVERAHRCRIEALEALAEVDAQQVETIRELQMKARIPSELINWLDEAIAEGKTAEDAIRAEDELDRNHQ